MNEKIDNIYAYVWEELNTIYIGRSKNLKSRHYQHKHISTEKTNKFSKENNIEHPPMIIIESGLTIDEGIEREKYWIKEYKENSSYNVLNKKCGGQIGNLLKYCNEEEIEKRNKEYKEKCKIYRKKYYESHKEKFYQERKEKVKEYQKEYYHNNKDKIKSYIEKNKNKINNYQKKYQKENKEKFYQERKEKVKEYQITHLNELKEYRKKYYEDNKEKLKKYRKEYYKNNKEKFKKYKKNA